jgi:hypothetical protein
MWMAVFRLPKEPRKVHVRRSPVMLVKRIQLVNVGRSKQLAGREAQELQNRDGPTQNHVIKSLQTLRSIDNVP